MVQKVRRGVADVATSRKRVELQLTQLQLLFAVSRHTASRHPRTSHASGPAGVPPPTGVGHKCVGV
jgi:hypothetical protein